MWRVVGYAQGGPPIDIIDSPSNDWLLGIDRMACDAITGAKCDGFHVFPNS